MYFVHPAIGECFFLRLLLTVVSSVTSFEHLRIIDNIEHLMFQVAYEALGLLHDDTEWDMCMCDFFIVMLSFESRSVMGKISRRYVAQYATSTHHKWRHYRGYLQRHPIILQGQINVDEQRLVRLSENVVCFAA